jgi:hypothetical protein
MSLPKELGDREYQKFVEDEDGNDFMFQRTAIRLLSKDYLWKTPIS